jgi:hypothetical protein
MSTSINQYCATFQARLRHHVEAAERASALIGLEFVHHHEVGNHGRLPFVIIAKAEPVGREMVRNMLRDLDGGKKLHPALAPKLEEILRTEVKSYSEVILPTVLKLARFDRPPANYGSELRRCAGELLRMVDHHLQGFDVGVPEDRGRGDVNTINIHGGAQAIVQQGGRGNQQRVEISIDWHAVRDSLSNLDRVLHQQSEVRAALDPDLKTIKAQLQKSEPSVLIVTESAKSLRSIFEGMVGAAVVGAPAVAPHVQQLLRLIGLG